MEMGKEEKKSTNKGDEEIIDSEWGMSSHRDFYVYSNDFEYEDAIKKVNDLENISIVPEKAKNAIAITMFILEQAFESRSIDFVKKAFELFQDKEYLLITQPHNLPESQLISHFTEIKKKPESTYPHVLYVLHRDALKAPLIRTRYAVKDDFENIQKFYKEIDEDYLKKCNTIYETILILDNPQTECLISEVNDNIIGLFLVTTGINLPYYKSHFHLEEFMISNQHDRNANRRIIEFNLNPIFIKFSREIIREILRLTGSTCFYSEIKRNSIIPFILEEMVHVKNRRFPHFLKRKWFHERFQFPEIDDYKRDQDGGDLDPLDEEDAVFSLFLFSKKFVSENKRNSNTRIVIVGA